MPLPLRPLDEQVVVVTGACSDVGLAVARRAAGCGARVVVAGPDTCALETLVAEVVAAGGSAVPVTADVARQDDVARTARVALAAYGRIDTWVTAPAAVPDPPDDDPHHVLDTAFWAVAYGCVEALRHVQERVAAGDRSGGAVVTVGRARTSLRPVLAGAEDAVRDWSEQLQAQVAHEGTQVSVTLLPPDLGHPDGAPCPPGRVADAVLYAARHPTPAPRDRVAR